MKNYLVACIVLAVALFLAVTPVSAASPDGVTPQIHDVDQLVFSFCYELDGSVATVVYYYGNGPFYVTDEVKIHENTAVLYDRQGQLHRFRFRKRYDVHNFRLASGSYKTYEVVAEKPLPTRGAK